MTQTTNNNTLFVDYLNTCNAALDAHKNEFPYDKIIAAGDKMLDGKKLGVAIYKDDPDKPHDFFTVRFSGGAFELLKHGKDDPNVAWKTSQEHMRQVVENKQEYIEHPAKLDLDWMKSRVGIA